MQLCLIMPIRSISVCNYKKTIFFFPSFKITTRVSPLLLLGTMLLLGLVSPATDCSDCAASHCNCALFPCPDQSPPSSTLANYTKGLPDGQSVSLPLVDYNFMAAAEGECQCSYLPFASPDCAVPADQGLNIGLGIELGDKSPEYFARAGVSAATIEKLQPILLKGDGSTAVSYCQNSNWTACRVQLSSAEEQQLSQRVLDYTVTELQGRYDDAKLSRGGGKRFADLPRGVRTAISSIYYEFAFGSYPGFWAAVVSERWEDASNELLHFPGPADEQPRRVAEETIMRLALVPPCVQTEPRQQVMFILDSSGSIGTESYEQEKNFVYNLCSQWKISDQNVRVAIIIFSSTVQVITSFTGNKESVLAQIKQIPYLQGATATGDAIRTGIKYFQENQAGTAAPRIMFLLTDGWSNQGENVSTAIRDMKVADVNCFAVGVGSDVRLDELRIIASRPENVYNVSSFSQLGGILDDLNKEACYSPAIVGLNKTVSVKLQENITYFSTIYDPTTGATFYFTLNSSSSLQVYYSKLNANPSSQYYSGKGTTLNSTTVVFSVPPGESLPGPPGNVSSKAPLYFSLVNAVASAVLPQPLYVTIKSISAALFSTSCGAACALCDYSGKNCYISGETLDAGGNVGLAIALSISIAGGIGLAMLVYYLLKKNCMPKDDVKPTEQERAQLGSP